MSALVWLFLKDNWRPLAYGLAIAMALGALYLKGRNDGVAIAEAGLKQAIFNQLKERNITDEKVQSMSDPELCRAIGGVWSDNRCQ